MGTTDYNLSITNLEMKKFFQITFHHSIKNRIKIYLFIDCKFTNYELVQTLIINKQEWVYHYYIPLIKNKNFSNVLILGLSEDYCLIDVIKNLNPSLYLNKPDQILNIIESIDWSSLNIYDQSCKWSNQEFFAELLDFISCGEITSIPPH